MILLFVSICSLANVGWVYVGTKHGITIINICPREDSARERRQQDAFLGRLVSKLKRPKALKILLLLNPFVMYPGFHPKADHWFASISYDTLRHPDPDFIADIKKFRPYWTYDVANSDLGLKVIGGFLHWDSTLSYDRVYTLIQYGIDHIEEIKREQQGLIFDFPYYANPISLLTIDTAKIKSLPLLSLGFDPARPTKRSYSLAIWCSIAAMILIIGFFLIRWLRLRQEKN